VGRTLKQARFRDRYHANVLSIKRGGEIILDNAADVVLRFGDTLLVEGRRRPLSAIRDEHRHFVVIAEPRELREPARNTRRAPFAIVIMLGMLVLMTFGLVSNVTAVILAAVAMVLTRCLTMVQAYRTINWESVVLIAAILPMSTALKKTGALQVIVKGLLDLVGDAGPIVVMASLFVLTSLFSQVISNTATTVLVAPIAFQIAKALETQGSDASPQAFMMVVAIAASTAFATPIASPVNTLVMGPGGYKFTDFLKIGVILQVFILVATLLVVPLLF
jgi:di/tricarboxylate transporter